MSQPEEITDPAVLKAMAHPLRRRIVAELRRGPASATTLAAALQENTGSTSYHLRELAKHGFVEDEPSLGKGKERWWRVVKRDLRYPRRYEQSAEMAAALDELNAVQLAEDLAAWKEFQAQSGGMGSWGDAVPYSRGSIVVTQEELGEFFEDYLALLKRYWREDVPADAREVLLRFIAFPKPE
ncbi:helix-turn-helix domain-containing protein [Umezawaea endophytica]|uniref:Helix-turn-helix domain-containing protein n=1 Tax=Umezawaea endophytica TaxID=1654476 RepID=A0A9X2VWM4_9PSEU|nr:helix-turn-helix domain-containing protein [Umezawaea endophytica]MCS7483956.1 helix-turn-helix domain-containing protein [Umezawaea endophytica]